MKKTAFLLLAGFLAGTLTTLGAVRVASGISRDSIPAASAPVAARHEPFTVTLYRFQLTADKLDRFEEWVRFEHAHHAETLATLEREKMYAEAIFRDREHQPDVIYWLAINGKGEAVDTSPLPIDKQYQAFMRETLKPGSRRALTTEYSLVPDFVVQAIDTHEQRR